jgi:hypothetical protein
MTFNVQWIDRGFEPRQKPDPKYPTGIDLDLSKGAAATCRAELPYPAKRVGFFQIRCDRCDQSAIVTTAGRPDDPRSVTLACKRRA